MAKIENKQALVSDVKEKLAKAKSVVLVDSRGLTVSEDTVLRKKLREIGIDYKVYKNSIMDFAIKDTEFESLGQLLSGPTAVAISYEDATSAARVINKEIKTMPNLEFKGAVVENTFYDADGIKAIADIPSREELLSKLLGSFKSPMSAFARVIQAVADKKGEVTEA